MKRPYSVGLTGGIGSGKSLVARHFEMLGAEVVDTDVLARELTEPGGAAIAAIKMAFGPGMVTETGAMDRPRMRALVFADQSARQRLEGILHPMIRQAVAERLAVVHAPYALVVVPLLVETGAYASMIDRVLVVDCEPDQQLDRVARRDGIDHTMAEAILAAQADRAHRLAAADDILDNRGTPEALAEQVARLHQDYLARAMRREHVAELQ